MNKQIIFMLPFILLNACATEQQAIAPVTTQIQSQPSQPATQTPAPKPVEVVTEEQKQEVENITWKLPDWCEDLEQNFNQIQVCGVALHKNLQMSRTRSEMDARKQLARRASGQVDETITETTSGSNSDIEKQSMYGSNEMISPFQWFRFQVMFSG